jgi:hypothetical protein
VDITSPLNAWRPKEKFVPSTAAPSGTTAAAAAEHQRKMQRDEELMTKYSVDEIEGWEFKIVRASTRKFKDPEFFRKVCEEEARAGWEMLEKFDDNRIRFRRKIEHPDGDLHRDIDPYRTLVGISADQLGLLIAASVLAGLGTLLGVVFWLTNVAK